MDTEGAIGTGLVYRGLLLRIQGTALVMVAIIMPGHDVAAVALRRTC